MNFWYFFKINFSPKACKFANPANCNVTLDPFCTNNMFKISPGESIALAHFLVSQMLRFAARSSLGSSTVKIRCRWVDELGHMTSKTIACSYHCKSPSRRPCSCEDLAGFRSDLVNRFRLSYSQMLMDLIIFRQRYRCCCSGRFLLIYYPQNYNVLGRQFGWTMSLLIFTATAACPLPAMIFTALPVTPTVRSNGAQRYLEMYQNMHLG